MTDFKEEAYVLEKMEISEDEDDGFEYAEIKDSEGGEEAIEDIAMDSVQLDDDDLNDFNALKTKTEAKRLAAAAKAGTQVSQAEAVPRTLQRDVVVDDFIRNFLQKFEMSKTLNIF